MLIRDLLPLIGAINPEFRCFLNEKHKKYLLVSNCMLIFALQSIRHRTNALYQYALASLSVAWY